MKKNILVANWKMPSMSSAQACSFLQDLPLHGATDVRIAPPFTLIREMAKCAQRVRIGAQNMHPYAEGAFTGEISAGLLKEAGADFVILGHSERRYLLGETNEFIQAKVERAIVHQLEFILCVGETPEEKDLGETIDAVTLQLDSAFENVDLAQLRHGGACIAYEPVWAIGTGKTPKLSEIEEMVCFIKEKYDLPVLYGGSVNSENFEELIQMPCLDGVLVGGASLDAAKFGQMINLSNEGWK